MDNKIKEVIQYSSFFYFIMVFLSFFQVHMFYNYFGVAIYYFTSIFELLFYFIPYFIVSNFKVLLIWPWGLIVGLAIVSFYYIDLMYYNKFYMNRFVRYFAYPSKTIQIIFAILILIGLCFWCNLIYHTLSGDDFSDFNKWLLHSFINTNGDLNILFQFLYLFWCIALYLFFIPLNRRISKNNYPSFLYSVLAIVLFMFFFSSLKTSYQIYKIIYFGSDNYRFRYLGNVTKSTDNFKVIGTTKEYLFMKDFSANKIYIYEFSNIDSLEVTKR